LTAGESHGPALVAILEGVPAGVAVTSAEVVRELARRRLGYGRGARMSFEQDQVEIVGGLRHGVTLGSPVAIRVGNTEWPKWRTVMAADPVEEAELAGQSRNAPLTRPRPGHADLAGMQKYGYADARPILERASARETAARVAVGTVAKAMLRQGLGIEILSHVVELGPVAGAPGLVPQPGEGERIDADPLRCLDPEASAAMVAEVDAAKRDADTLGGVVEVLAYGVPPGLGSHVQWDRKLDGRLAQALMSIPAIKAVGIGRGPQVAALPGSRIHDEILPAGPAPVGVVRPTNNAGGLEGGITNGEDLRVTAYMKPIATLMKPLRSVDLTTMADSPAAIERSDVCAVSAAAVVGEAMVAFVLADALVEKFGGDSAEDLAASLERYRKRLRPISRR
jgi:chorismate synthase